MRTSSPYALRITHYRLEMPISLTNPAALFLLVLLIPGALLIARLKPPLMPPTLRRISVGLRLLIVLLLVLSLAGVRLGAQGGELSVVFLTDNSDSVPTEVQAAARDWVQTAIDGKSSADSAGVVSFGRGAEIERPLAANPDTTEF